MLFADLDRKQRHRPEGQRDHAARAVGGPKVIQPVEAQLVGIIVDIQHAFGRAQLDRMGADIEIPFGVFLDDAAVRDSQVAQNIGAVVFGISGEADGFDDFQPAGLVLHQPVKLFARP